ncbi:DUF2249 domain-containing protein [Salinibacter altiplanensis]|uniref:DUF2249 domain-containing protein n=1 Tax=Salinibacter altiplanensis TaxID=1803181 RepID=UPI0018F8A401|nr:DUF2249 domain-containing protein [Salinibacter altiplanensis]
MADLLAWLPAWTAVLVMGGTTLDVRPLRADRKLESVLSVFDGLDVGESFVLVDDVDPGEMSLRIEQVRPGEVRWRALTKGPRVWCVRVERGPAAA